MNNPVNNPELKNNLELLAKKTFTLYNDVLKLNGQSPSTANTFQISIMINGLAHDINRFGEFNRCVELMHADTTIRSLLGKLVGTTAGRATIENAEICIFRFIQQAYLDKTVHSILKVRVRDRKNICKTEAGGGPHS